MSKVLASMLEQLADSASRVLSDIDNSHTGWYYQLLGDMQHARTVLRDYNKQQKETTTTLDVTEADEAATTKERALENLRYQVTNGETMGVIAMYEQAAYNAGASYADIQTIIKQTRGTHET